MDHVVIIIGTIFLLGSQLAETISPNCRCKTDKFTQHHNLSSDCELIPTLATQETFNKYLKEKKIFITMNITFIASSCERQISNSHNDCNDTDDELNEVLFPYQWTWVYKGENGMFPLMSYPYDYNIHSLWTLNKTKRPLDAVLRIPDNCTVTMGNASLLRRAFQSLSKMSEKINPSWTGYLCYDIDNSNSRTDFYLLVQHYVGFVRGITVKYCCPLKKRWVIDENQMNTYNDQMRPDGIGDDQDDKLCAGEVVPTTMLMNLTTILGVMNFIFTPLILCFFLKEEQLFDNVQPDATHEWISADDGVFNYQHLLRWITWWDHPSLIASRIRRILFIVLSPFIVYYHIIAEYFFMSDIQNEYLKRNIPLGVKSIPFGFSANYRNTYGFFGGTLTWGAIYFTFTCVLICLPENVGDAMIGNLQLQEESHSTFLILSPVTLKRYSSIDIRGHKNYQLAFETLKANLIMVLNYKFWLAIFVRWKNRIRDLWTVYDERVVFMFCHVVIAIFKMIVYTCVFLLEITSCFCYYGFPILFVFFSINVRLYEKIAGFWFDWMSQSFRQIPNLCFEVLFVFSIIISFLLILYLFLLTFYLCLCSFFILNLTIMFTLIGIIITPEIIGYLAYVMSAMFYIDLIYQRFTAKYNKLFELVAKTPSIYAVRNKNIQFIRRDIFYAIVEHIRPLRSEIFLLLSKYFLLFLYLSMSYNIIRQYELSLQYTEKILSCLIITQVPNIAINVMTQLTSNTSQDEFNEIKKVKKFLKTR